MALETDLANIRVHIETGLAAVQAAVANPRPPGVAELESLANTLQADLAQVQATLRAVGDVQAATQSPPNTPTA